MKNENEDFLKWLHSEGVSIFDLHKHWGAIPYTVAILGWYKKWVALGRPHRTTADTQREESMIKRYDVSAYCHRCGSAEGAGAVEVTYDEDKNGGWVGHHDHVTSLNIAQQLKDEICSSCGYFPCVNRNQFEGTIITRCTEYYKL